MSLTKKQRTIKYLVCCLLILVAHLLQNIGGMWLEIGGARCFFIIPVAVALGIDEDERVSALFGFFAGFLWDCVSSSHMGFNFIFLALACYISSALVSYLLRATYWVTAISCISSTVLYCVLYWLFFVVINGSDGAVKSIGYFYIPCIIYTSVISLLICLGVEPLKRRLNHEPKMD